MPVSSVSTTIEPVFDERQRAETVAALRRRLDTETDGDRIVRRLNPDRPATESTGSTIPGLTARAPHSGAPSGTPDPEAIAAPGPLAAVLPRHGLPKGGVVSVMSGHVGPARPAGPALSGDSAGRARPADGRPESMGGGATSLLLSLLAAPAGCWIAVVGMPGLGLAAAAEFGIDLDRLAVIPDPGSDVLQVLSILSDGVDLIVTTPPVNLPPARLRVLTGRLRQRGAVLLVAGRWPGADLVLTARDVRWTGLGDGHGRLGDRELDVEVAGRRLGASRMVTLAFRASRTTVSIDEGRSAVVGAASSGASVMDATAHHGAEVFASAEHPELVASAG